MGLLANKVIIITGAASGIGRATACRASAQGAHLILLDLNEPGLIETQSLLPNSSTSCLLIPADVTLEKTWANAIQKTIEEFDRLDGLVNCAGKVEQVSIENSSLEQFQSLLAVNLESAFLGLKYAYDAMKNNAEGGAIINVSSVLGQLGLEDHTAYSASKGGIRLMTKAAAIEFGMANSNVRVNSLHPGTVNTPLIEGLLDHQKMKKVTEQIPLKRLASAEDIANTIVYLLCDGAKFMTGSEVTVDGGLTSRLPLPSTAAVGD